MLLRTTIVVFFIVFQGKQVERTGAGQTLALGTSGLRTNLPSVPTPDPLEAQPSLSLSLLTEMRGERVTVEKATLPTTGAVSNLTVYYV